MRPLAASYPFGALVGQDALKQALLLGAVDPSLGGVLIRGEKGTAKSTAARALAALLPPIRVNVGCPHRCDPDRPWPDCPVCAESDHAGCVTGSGRTTTDQEKGTGSSEERAAACPPFPIDLPATADAPDHAVVEIPTPHVDLPLGATEDRVLGTLDLQQVLRDGRATLKPGLLAEAHRGILYIDEVNLLADHLVDSLLDVATSGVNTVQRDGVAARHPSRFLLIGSMNAEEGELRPQLLDRFGLSVDVAAPGEVEARTEVVRRRLAFEADPTGFAARWADEDRALGAQVARARANLAEVVMPDGLLAAISHLCIEARVAGLRADLALYKAARALAALDGRRTVRRADLADVAEFVLVHRCRKSISGLSLNGDDLRRMLQGIEPPPDLPNAPDHRDHEPNEPNPTTPNEPTARSTAPNEPTARSKPTNEPTARSTAPNEPKPADPPGGATNEPNIKAPNEPNTTAPNEPKARSTAPNEPNATTPNEPNEAGRGQPERVLPPGSPMTPLRLPVVPVRRPGTLPGQHAARGAGEGQGAYLRPVRAESPRELALDATLRAAVLRGGVGTGAMPPIERGDFHGKERRAEVSTLVLFVVDTSGSMSARRRTETVKAAVLDLLGTAYQQRDRVAVITARGPRAEVALAPTRSVDQAELALRQLPTGGRTPLAHALALAVEVVGANARHGPTLVVVLTDGRANVSIPGTDGDPWEQALASAASLAALGASGVVFDTEDGFGRAGRAVDLAVALGAGHFPLARFSADTVQAQVDAPTPREARR